MSKPCAVCQAPAWARWLEHLILTGGDSPRRARMCDRCAAASDRWTRKETTMPLKWHKIEPPAPAPIDPEIRALAEALAGAPGAEFVVEGWRPAVLFDLETILGTGTVSVTYPTGAYFPPQAVRVRFNPLSSDSMAAYLAAHRRD